MSPLPDIEAEFRDEGAPVGGKTREWVRYDLPFSDFVYPGWGVNAPYAGTIMGFVFESKGPDFDIGVDEIMLYTQVNSGGAGSADGNAGAAGNAGASAN